MLVLFVAGALQFYGAWSIDFAWHGRETTGKVGLPFPGRLVHVSDRSWWFQAWIAMVAGVVLLVLFASPLFSFIGLVGVALAGLGLLFVWYPWHSGRGGLGGGYAATWNVAFFFGVVGGSLLMLFLS